MPAHLALSTRIRPTTRPTRITNQSDSAACMPGRVPVANQSPALVGYNLFETDLVLTEGLRRECAAWAEPTVSNFGRLMGAEETIRWGFQANQSAPVLHT